MVGVENLNEKIDQVNSAKLFVKLPSLLWREGKYFVEGREEELRRKERTIFCEKNIWRREDVNKRNNNEKAGIIWRGEIFCLRGEQEHRRKRR